MTTILPKMNGKVEGLPSGVPFRLETAQPGLLKDLDLKPTTRQIPDRHEVEIEVCAIGLNLREVLKALGVYPQVEGPVLFGGDCAGRVIRFGKGVTEFRVGDEVVGHGATTFRSHAVLPASLVAPKPSNLTFEEASTVPIAFLTAYYALVHLGRIKTGERVLIHAAAGGVGMAAVKLCLHRKAEIFATAGSERKRRFLRELGIEHVMNSRTLDFVKEIDRITHGKGVDVVLNSLAGEFLIESLNVLGEFGRFLEIGKRDIYENTQIGLYPFRKNLAFFAVDLERAPIQKGKKLFLEIMHMMERGDLAPLPFDLFPLSRFRDAFRFMRQSKHLGKVVIALKE